MDQPQKFDEIRREATLPLNRPRSQIFSNRISTVRLTLSSYHEKIFELDKTGDLSTAILGAVAATLFRYGYDGNLCVGYDTGTEYHQDGALPIVINVSPTLKNRTLLDIARSVCSKAKFSDMTFDQYVLMGNLNHIENRNPLYSISVKNGLTSTTRKRREDVVIWFEPSPTPSFIAEYSSRLFKEKTVERFLKHTVNALMEIIDDKKNSSTIATIDLLSANEKNLIAKFSQGPKELGVSEDGIIQLFLKTLSKWPDEIALIFKEHKYTYTELDKRSNQLANVISSAGIKPGEYVGISILPSAEQIIAAIAIIKCGGVLVPFDSTFPKNRLKLMIQDAEISGFVTEESLENRFGDLKNKLILERISPTIDSASSKFSCCDVDLNSPLYLMFTSGSTGNPKGVKVAHRTLINLVNWQNGETEALKHRTLCRTSLAFDVGLQEIFSTLCFGGILWIANDTERADVASLYQTLVANNIWRVFLPPVALQQMAESSDFNQPLVLPLEYIIVAGDRLQITPPIVRFFRACSAKLVNQYGPTETHVATSYHLGGTSLKWPQMPSIGRPIANTRLFILDNNLNHCPLEVNGEIYIGGLSPALGYHRNQPLTSERFIELIADGDSSDILYKTGDIGRLNDDGNYEYVKRNDEQIKLRGYRIELGDIEANALLLQGINQAVARTWQTKQDYILALYVVLEHPRIITSSEIRQKLSLALPEHMLPSIPHIIELEAIPINSNGKIDRENLPPIEIINNNSSIFRKGIEGVIQNVWQKRLGVSDIQPENEFRELGGHSLLAIQVVSEINDKLSITIPLSSLLKGGRFKDFVGQVENIVLAKNASKIEKGSYEAEGKGVSLGLNKKAVILPDGRRVVSPYPPEATYLWKDIFEAHSYNVHGIPYEKSSTIIDVGANIGLFTIYALEHMQDGCVFAIEPSRITFEALKENLARFGEKTILLNVGCGSEDKDDVDFTYMPFAPGMSSYFPKPIADKELLQTILTNLGSMEMKWSENKINKYLEERLTTQTQKSSVRKLSTIIRSNNISKIDLLKIDVQHGEETILSGIEPEHWVLINQMVIEMQDVDRNLEGVINLLGEKGFIISSYQIKLHRNTNVQYIHAHR